MILVKLNPIFKSMIWGGTRLHDRFGFEIPSDTTGEAWVVSAHLNGDCPIDGGPYHGQRLSQFYADYRQRTKPGQTTEFPLLIKLIDAKENLSVQVHPDDEYAKVYEASRGKTECWLIVDCAADSEIIIGHDLTTQDAFERAVKNGTLQAHLKRWPIKPGDFFYIPAGTVHAICANTLIYEVQQNSDVTYRIDDYGRTDALGNPRPLHVRQAMAVTRFPHQIPPIQSVITTYDQGVKTTLIDNDFFTIERLQCFGVLNYEINSDDVLFGCLEGEVAIDGLTLKPGDHALAVDVISSIRLSGQGVLIISTPRDRLF